MWVAHCFLYATAAAPVLIATAHETEEGLKGRVTYRKAVTITSQRKTRLHITKYDSKSGTDLITKPLLI